MVIIFGEKLSLALWIEKVFSGKEFEDLGVLSFGRDIHSRYSQHKLHSKCRHAHPNPVGQEWLQEHDIVLSGCPQ
jgi:hypothetical protein